MTDRHVLTPGPGPAVRPAEGRALVVIAHGSRREASNDEVRTLAERLRARARETFPIVEHGFLELAEPSIDETLDRVIARGAREVVVLPYFLAAGRHVCDDVPQAVEACRQRHPDVSVEVTPHLGATEALADLLLRMAGDAPASLPTG